MAAPKLSPADLAEISRRYAAGDSSLVLASAFGVSSATILRKLNADPGVVLRSFSFLSPAQRLEAVARYQAGETSTALAADFGCTPSGLCSLLRQQGVVRPPSQAHRRYRLNEQAFDVLTPEACYWAGFLFADGHIEPANEQRKMNAVLKVRLSERDREHLEALRAFLGSDLPIRTQAVQPGDFANARPRVMLAASSAHLTARLRELGMRPGNASVAAPELAASADFWRGLVDGDGFLGLYTVQKRGRPDERLQLGLVGGEELLEQFVGFIRTVHPAYGGSVLAQPSIYSVRTLGRATVALVQALYTNAPIALARKAALAVDILKKAPI